MADAQQAAMEMQTVQRRLQLLDRNLAQLESSLEEIHTAIATLEGLTGDEPVEAKVPVGAGVRVSAKVDPSAKVLVELGNHYSSELSIPEALERLRDRLRNTEAAFRNTSDEADKAARRMQNLQQQSMAAESSSDSS